MSNCLKNWKVIISVVLAILTAIMLPVEVFAQAAPKHNPSAKVKFDSLAESEDVGEIVTELKERRDEYTKHFRMDDGTIMALTYDIPVHYKNKKGEWIDYDNTLISESTASPDEASQISYSNKKGKIDIDFASETSDAALISLNSSKGNLSWEYVDAKKSNIKIDKTKKKLTGNDRFTSIDNLSSKASYKSIYDKVNLDCIVSTVGVKENIILQDKSAQNEFNIEYNIKGFTAKQTDKQTIKLYKDKKAIYTISAPCMYDANKKTNTNLALKITNNKDDKLSIKLTADKDFLNNAKYPVTIDPEVSLNGFASTETAYVVDSEPNTVKHQSTTFGVGKSGSAYLSGLVKCKNVSDTLAEKNIVSAKLNIFPMNYSTEMEIDAHQITSSWTNSTATYNNVSYDSEIIDYTSTKNNSESEVTFDITKVFKKWANGIMDNNGVYLKSNSDFTDFGGSSCYFPGKRPTYVVKYKEYTGLENNLTSHTVPCGRDAVLSVCDYTGSLSVNQSFFEENTARLPLSIFATYHSARNAVNEQTGYGWHYSFNQTISKDNNYYKYIDANGVDHYFKRENNDDNQDEELSDEDDLGLSLKRDHTTNKITIDNDSITQTYQIVDNSDIYKLKNEKSNDNESNTISYTYNDAGYITDITSSLGEYKVYRTNDNYISRIKTPNDKYMYFVYYSGTSKIARFTAVDGKATNFYYESNSNDSKLIEVRYYNEDGAALGGGATCDYTGDKVGSITELGKNGTSRTALSVNYPDENRTEFYENGNEDKKETYTFDNYGNTVSVLNANGMITTSNNSSSLSINTGADSYTKNYLGNTNEINSIASSPATEVYYSNAEAIDGVTSDCGTVSIDDTVSYLGSKSIKVQNDGNSQFFTVAKYQKRIEDLAGKTVTLSAYVKLDKVKKGNRDTKGGAIVRLEAFKQPGPREIEVISPAIVNNLNGMEWQRISVTVKIPEVCNHYYYEVSFGLYNATGAAWFDCMQLEKGSVANDYNALSNSDFSSTSNWKTQDDNTITVNDQKAMINGSGGEPSPTEETTSAEPDPTTSTEETTEEPNVETYTAIETETVLNDVVEEKNTHGNVVKTEQGFVTRKYKRTYEVDNNATEPEETSTAPESSGDEGNEPQTISCNKYIYQEVPVNKKDVSFVISGSAKANSVPLNSEYRTFGIALKIKYDGDAGYTEDHYQAFNACVDSMQNISLSVTPNDSERVVASVAFAFVYGYNKNKMEIKNAMLNLAYNGVSQEQPSTTETTEPETTDPEATDPPATETTATGTTATDPENNEPSEPGRGELIDEEVQEETINTEQPYMRSENIYETNGNYVATEIDEAGNTTEYERDHDGNVTQLTDGRGNSTSYSYDVHNNLLSVTAVDENTTYSNTYTYNSYNELSKTTHHGFDYNYTYNNFGEQTSVKVGSQALITYTYDNNGNVSNATYGNGYSLDYHYDNYGRITSVTTEGNNNETVTLAEYIYNKKNQVKKFVDGKSGETTEYCYDCNGNLLYKYLISSGGSLLRVVEDDTEKTTINGSERTITNGTDDDGKSYVQNGKAKITSDTDDFGRTSNVKTSIKVGDDFVDKFNLTYTYKSVLGDNNQPTHRTTNNVNQMIYKLRNDETPLVEYSYSYDINGNITEICEGTNTIAEYKYDSLNQLQECADKNANKYFVYNYNSGGNITSVDIHSLINGMEKGSLERTETYSYATSGWKDKLVSYKNDSIIYDDIGNPTNYRDGIEMSWSGRELKSLNKSGYTYNFTYNLDGLRTKRIKEQNNTVLETVNYYYDDSNNLIGLKKGETTVLFYYDSEGKVYSMTKGDDTYFFVKNLQGDVTKIIDENGTVCATYAYDAWGGILATKNENGQEITDPNHIAFTNPFRYRGYVYDTETELYYLQSRYYDPKTGRFINTDDSAYTDTYSGSPLSTNMFAYCENNAINGYDPTGNWDLTEHRKMCLQRGAKFSQMTWSWNMLADIVFFSTSKKGEDNYSSPFHSRDDSLDIAKSYYNAAVNLKKSINEQNTNELVKIDKCSNHNSEGFYNDKTEYLISSNYISYYNKDTESFEPNGEKTEVLLNYLNGASFSKSDKKRISEKRKKRGLNYNISTKINNRQQQSEALLGLALHILQDYYAHLIKVPSFKKYKNGKPNDVETIIPHKPTMTYINNNLIAQGKTQLIEDNTSFLSWRSDNAYYLTSDVIYECYKHKEEIENIKLLKQVLRKTIFYIKAPNEKPSLDFNKPKNYKKDYYKYILNYYYITMYLSTPNYEYEF